MGISDFFKRKTKKDVEEIDEVEKSEDLIKSVLLWLKNSLRLNSVALLKNLAPDYRLVLKWIDTDRKNANLRKEFLWGEGLLGGIGEKKGIFIAENLKDREWNLPFFTKSQKLTSFFAIPIGDGEPSQTPYILCGERLRERDFIPEEVEIIKNVREIVTTFFNLQDILISYKEEIISYKDLLKTAFSISEKREKSELFSTIIHLAERIYPCKCVVLSIFLEEERKFLIVAGKGEEFEEIKGKTFGHEDGLVGLAIQQKVPLPEGFKYKKSFGNIISEKIPLFIEEEAPLGIFPLIIKEFSEGCLILTGGESFSQRMIETLKLFSILSAGELQTCRINENLLIKAATDSLTGLYNRRSFLLRLEEVFADCERHKKKFALLFIDIDNFKQINDKYGHITGDRALKIISHRIKEATRRSDMAGRYGGEEFAIILTETDDEGALKFAERLRKKIEETSIPVVGEIINLTISAGISTFPKHANKPQDLIRKADNALYRAKKEGKNKVMISG